MKIISVYTCREINITCKGLYNEKRANKEDLTSVLNEISIAYSEAAKYRRLSGLEASADAFEEIAHKLYKICEELGAYDDKGRKETK